MKAAARAGLALGIILAVAIAALASLNPLALDDWRRDPRGSFVLSLGGNPHPVRLLRPPAEPLSAMARLGKKIFHDRSLSSSGRLSCASCHDPAHDYALGSKGLAAGGPALAIEGARAVPSLMYLERQPNFSIGPPAGEDDDAAPIPASSPGLPPPAKTMADPAASAAVPRGGLFWDGRADTLQMQALLPLISPAEMDGGSIAHIADRLGRAAYRGDFAALFGEAIFSKPQLLTSEAMFALARYQIEERSFHPYASKYDFWLEGKARLSAAELRGYIAFNDPDKGNCAACHAARVQPDGLPPLFTDHEFEALGVPRNPALAADPGHFDLGLCGPYRGDLKDLTRYCGMFATPSLRNVARRHAFFHNGVYTSLQQVLDFYNFRGPDPARIYPGGKAAPFNDLPRRYWPNIDVADAPFTARRPAMSARDERDLIAFLGALSDGFQPEAQ